MRKRLLILTDSIAPPAYAPRVVSLCRYLTEQGWQCDVFSDCEKGNEPFTAAFGRWYSTSYYRRAKRWHYIADKVFGARERQFQHFIEETVDVAKYDAIFCSTCYYFPLLTTYHLSHKYHKPYVVDMRDIAEQWGNIAYNTTSVFHSRSLNLWLHRAFTAHNIHIRNRVLAAATHVVTVSPWHKELLSRYNPSTHLIYNGYDQKDFYPEDVPSDKFIISYTGKIYNLDFRDPRLLFEAMQQLLVTKQIAYKDVQLNFFIDKTSIKVLQQMIDHYGLTRICQISEYIPKTELLPLMHQSSILLVLTCLSTPEGAHGIMGTKFFEALGVQKPVLCIRSDEECLAQVIQETNAGLAGKRTDEVATFILDKYTEWKQKGFTRQHTQHSELFTRQYQSAQIAQLL